MSSDAVAFLLQPMITLLNNCQAWLSLNVFNGRIYLTACLDDLIFKMF